MDDNELNKTNELPIKKWQNQAKKIKQEKENKN